jgi:hypothetical protein
MNNKTSMIKRKGLSRFITVCIIAVGVGSLFSGCGSTTSKTSNSTNTAKSTTTQAKATATSNNSSGTDNNSSNSGQTNNSNSSQQNNASNATTPQSSSTKKQTSSPVTSNPIVYYVKGSKVYHLSKTDTALKNSKNVLSTTLKQAKAAGMHQSTSKN